MSDLDSRTQDYIDLARKKIPPVFEDRTSLVLKKSESTIVHEVVETDFGKKLEPLRIGTIVIDSDWNSGNFNWKGRSSRTGQPNQLIVNWSTYEIYWYLAEFTNLNNTYWAHPSFIYQYEAGNKVLSRACFDTMPVMDEDGSNKPTIRDVRARGPYRKFTPEADTIRFLYRGVHWTYFQNSQTCNEELL